MHKLIAMIRALLWRHFVIPVFSTAIDRAAARLIDRAASDAEYNTAKRVALSEGKTGAAAIARAVSIVMESDE